MVVQFPSTEALGLDRRNAAKTIAKETGLDEALLMPYMERITEREAADLARVCRDVTMHPHVAYESGAARTKDAVSAVGWCKEAQAHLKRAQSVGMPRDSLRHALYGLVHAAFAHRQAGTVLEIKKPFWEQKHSNWFAARLAGISTDLVGQQTRDTTTTATNAQESAGAVMMAASALLEELVPTLPAVTDTDTTRDLLIRKALKPPPAASFTEVAWTIEALNGRTDRSSSAAFVVARKGNALRLEAARRGLMEGRVEKDANSLGCYRCGTHLTLDSDNPSRARIKFEAYEGQVAPDPICFGGEPHESYRGQVAYAKGAPALIEKVRRYLRAG